ncbi:hypothetical protein [Flagellimonas alvinocaridis]|nr:hypothetical protein [Allomuricauda alvinocaridis]
MIPIRSQKPISKDRQNFLPLLGTTALFRSNTDPDRNRGLVH